MLRSAFAELIDERGIEGFSVSELAERADLNRGTFYAHYKDKDALLASFEDEIIDDLLRFEGELQRVSLKELLLARTTGSPPRVAIRLFDTLRDHGSLLKVLLGAKGDAAFQARFRDVVCMELVRSVLNRRYREHPSALTEYYVAFYASAQLGVIQRWLERGMAEGSETMARVLLGLLFMKPGDRIEVKGLELQ
jgi:AcrR family transcriptional regulator